MDIRRSIPAILAIVVGILIIILPEWFVWLVGSYLILLGFFGLLGIKQS